MAEERKQGWTAEQKRQIAANRRERARQAKYGWDPGPMGPAARARAEAMLRDGPFVPLSYLRQWRNGVLYLRPTARQTGRLTAGNWGEGEWRPASEVLSPGHYAALQRTTGDSAHAQMRRNFAAQNPGASYYDYLGYKFAQGLPVDPATGLRVMKSGELRTNYGKPVDGLATPPGGGGTGTGEGSDPIVNETNSLRRRYQSNYGLGGLVSGVSPTQPPPTFDPTRRRGWQSGGNFWNQGRY